MLTAKTSDTDYIEAADAVRGVEYACRGCGAPVVFKPGRIRTKHFAHYPGAECSYGALMSAEHLQAQRVLIDALRARGVGAALEVPIASLAGDRRADVMTWPKERPDKRIAIEVQGSDITIDRIEARTESYNTEGIAPLWLRLYDFEKWDQPAFLAPRKTIWIEKHRLRSWERWAYDHLGSRLWFMDRQTFQVWRGTFVEAHSYVEVSTWYGPGGIEESAGGDWRNIKAWVELELEGPFPVERLLLARGRVAGADGKARLGAWFLTPGENERPTEPLVRAVFLKPAPPTYFTPREVQTKVAGAWVRAEFGAAPDNWRRSSS